MERVPGELAWALPLATHVGFGIPHLPEGTACPSAFACGMFGIKALQYGLCLFTVLLSEIFSMPLPM